MSGEMVETEQLQTPIEAGVQGQDIVATTVAESLGLRPVDLLEGSANAVRSLGCDGLNHGS